MFIAGNGYVYAKDENSRVKAPIETLVSVLIPLSDAGELTARKLVEVSRPEDAPLHNEFEWDDASAAELYREHQARKIIRCVKVTVSTEQSEPVPFFWTRQYDGAAPQYKSITAIMRQKDERDQLYNDALRELRAFKAKYAALTEFAKLFAEIDSLLAEEPA